MDQTKDYIKPISKKLKCAKSAKYKQYSRGGCPCGCINASDASKLLRYERKAQRCHTKSAINKYHDDIGNYIIDHDTSIFRKCTVVNGLGKYARDHHVSYKKAREIIGETFDDMSNEIYNTWGGWKTRHHYVLP